MNDSVLAKHSDSVLEELVQNVNDLLSQYDNQDSPHINMPTEDMEALLDSNSDSNTIDIAHFIPDDASSLYKHSNESLDAIANDFNLFLKAQNDEFKENNAAMSENDYTLSDMEDDMETLLGETTFSDSQDECKTPVKTDDITKRVYLTAKRTLQPHNELPGATNPFSVRKRDGGPVSSRFHFVERPGLKDITNFTVSFNTTTPCQMSEDKALQQCEDLSDFKSQSYNGAMQTQFGNDIQVTIGKIEQSPKHLCEEDLLELEDSQLLKTIDREYLRMTEKVFSSPNRVIWYRNHSQECPTAANDADDDDAAADDEHHSGTEREIALPSVTSQAEDDDLSDASEEEATGSYIWHTSFSMPSPSKCQIVPELKSDGCEIKDSSSEQLCSITHSPVVSLQLEPSENLALGGEPIKIGSSETNDSEDLTQFVIIDEVEEEKVSSSGSDLTQFIIVDETFDTSDTDGREYPDTPNRTISQRNTSNTFNGPVIEASTPCHRGGGVANTSHISVEQNGFEIKTLATTTIDLTDSFSESSLTNAPKTDESEIPTDLNDTLYRWIESCDVNETIRPDAVSGKNEAIDITRSPDNSRDGDVSGLGLQPEKIEVKECVQSHVIELWDDSPASENMSKTHQPEKSVTEGDSGFVEGSDIQSPEGKGVKRPLSETSNGETALKKLKGEELPIEDDIEPDEIKDITDPRWKLHDINDPKAGFEHVRNQWGSDPMPKPHSDLTIRWASTSCSEAPWWKHSASTNKNERHAMDEVYHQYVKDINCEVQNSQQQLFYLLNTRGDPHCITTTRSHLAYLHSMMPNVQAMKAHNLRFYECYDHPGMTQGQKMNFMFQQEIITNIEHFYKS